MLALPIAGMCQQQKYKVKGLIFGVAKNAKAYVVYQQGAKMIIDSCRLINGAFTFSGTVDEPREASLVLGHQGKLPVTEQSDIQTIYLENGLLHVEGKDSLTKSRIFGTPLNADQEERATLMKNLKGNKRPAERKAMAGFVQSHPGSRVSLEWLYTFGPRDSVVIANYPLLSTELKQSKLGRELGAAIKTVLSIQVGQLAPDFTLNDQHGKSVKLSDFRGKYVLVDFWASWCKPCRAAQPRYLEYYKEFTPTGKFVILGVSMDKDKSAWLKAIEEDKVPWIQVADLNAPQNKVGLLYDVSMIPACYLIDPEGKIIANTSDVALLRQKLKAPVQTELSTLTMAEILEVLKNDHVKEEDISTDYQVLKAILNTDIGEGAILLELDKLDAEKNRQEIYNLLRDQAVPLANQKRKMTQMFITEHPDSYVSLQQLADLEFTYTVDGFASAYMELSDRMKKTQLAATIKARIESNQSTPTGVAAVNFTRKDQNGKSVKLSDYKGKLVLLDFWGSWCVVCREGNPHLKTLYKTYKDKGLVILGVAKENSKDLAINKAAWLAAIKADGIEWVNVLDNEGSSAPSIVAQYGVKGYPTKLLLDEKGKVLMRVTGTTNDEISEKIKLILDK